MRTLFLVSLLLAAPLLAGCVGGDDDPAGNAKLDRQATVSEDTGGIQGVVTDAAIQPISGITVTLRETSDTTRTAGDGSFAFSNVLPGTYTLQLEGEGFISSEQEVTVTSGNVAIVDVILAHVPEVRPFIQQQEFTGFVECSVRAGFGVAVCGAINLVAGGNATNDRFIFYWDLEPGLWQMVSEISWEPNQPLGSHLSYVVEPAGLSNDGKTEFGSAVGESPLIITTSRERVHEIDANATAVCEGDKEPESAISNEAEAYCNRAYAEEGGEVQARIFVSGQDTVTVPEAVPCTAGFCFGGATIRAGAGLQQEYQVISTMFYNAPACEDYSVFLGNECPQESTAREDDVTPEE